MHIVSEDDKSWEFLDMDKYTKIARVNTRSMNIKNVWYGTITLPILFPKLFVIVFTKINFGTEYRTDVSHTRPMTTYSEIK